VVNSFMALLSFVDSAPRAYWLKVSNACPPISTSTGTSPDSGSGCYHWCEVPIPVSTLIALAKMTVEDLGVVVDFGQHGNSRLFCAAGWSGFERDERWAIGSESRLNLPSPTAPGSYVLVLKLRPFVAPGRLSGQHLSVVVNGSVVGEFWLTDRTSRVCYLPWQLLDGRRELEITFRTPDAA
jgi:hypothetical protein